MRGSNHPASLASRTLQSHLRASSVFEVCPLLPLTPGPSPQWGEGSLRATINMKISKRLAHACCESFQRSTNPIPTNESRNT